MRYYNTVEKVKVPKIEPLLRIGDLANGQIGRINEFWVMRSYDGKYVFYLGDGSYNLFTSSQNMYMQEILPLGESITLTQNGSKE